MATERKQALVGLTMKKPNDVRQPLVATLSIEVEDDCYIEVELSEHQLAYFLSATTLPVEARVTRGSW